MANKLGNYNIRQIGIISYIFYETEIVTTNYRDSMTCCYWPLRFLSSLFIQTCLSYINETCPLPFHTNVFWCTLHTVWSNRRVIFCITAKKYDLIIFYSRQTNVTLNVVLRRNASQTNIIKSSIISHLFLHRINCCKYDIDFI